MTYDEWAARITSLEVNRLPTSIARLSLVCSSTTVSIFNGRQSLLHSLRDFAPQRLLLRVVKPLVSNFFKQLLSKDQSQRPGHAVYGGSQPGSVPVGLAYPRVEHLTETTIVRVQSSNMYL